MASNFDFLAAFRPDLSLIGAAAELQTASDPGDCALKLRTLAERVAAWVVAMEKVWVPRNTDMGGQIRLLQNRKLLPQRIGEILFALRKAGSDVRHGHGMDTPRAETLLRLGFHLCVWFYGVYGEEVFEEPEFAMPEIGTLQEDTQEQLRLMDERIAALEPVSFDDTLPEAQTQRQRRGEEIAGKLGLSDGEKGILSGQQIRLEVSALEVVNFALQQNRVPILHKVVLVNHSDQAAEHLQLHISGVPGFCFPVNKHIDFVAPGSAFEVKDLKLNLDPEYLAGLTEKVAGLLRFSLTRDETALYTEDVEITALSFDEWHGYGYHPELLAAFVTPNHPEIARINGEAAALLDNWTGDPSLDAYQTKDLNRVLSQAAAIYSALQAQQIVYAVPPASFELVGQRVRLCDTVLGQKMGTCLDLTLLYAACLEAAGLHPLLILKRGHIFAGVWLEDLSFPESVQDDSTLITKRMSSGVNEIAVVECTAFTAGKKMHFDRSRETAHQELLGENPVEYIIDVNRARLSGVSPLPLRIHTETGWHIQPGVEPAPQTSAPKEIGPTIEVEASAEADPMPKQTQWERKLLDLGLRNQLINMRLTKNTLPVLIPSLDELENALSDGSDFSIFPRPLDWVIPEDQIDFEMMHDLGGFEEVIKSEFRSRRLRSVYTDNKVSSILKDLYRTAKTSLEENGANTLYLALGVLRWYETAKSTKPRYAPVILLPVDIVRKSAAQGYVIRLRDDEAQMNVTMLEKMKQDFKLNISGLDPLPQDEHGIDTRKVFTVLRKAVMGQAKWDVLESAYLGVFSFSQFVMWNDMRNRTDDLARNKIVRSLMEGKLSWEARAMEIGQKVPEDHVFLPLSADASQLFAIEAACREESFVLHGPPGTGKSQTITALIANALAQGKTVLFVAEKMAALEVVQKRLKNIGIGPFCLELHSNKSKKRDVLEQLRQATEVTHNTSPEAYAARANQLASLRGELDAYAGALHRKQTCGLTLFEMISGYEAVTNAPEIEAFSPAFAAGMTAEKLSRCRTLVERLVAAGQAVGHPEGHPLTAVGTTRYSQRIRSELRTTVNGYCAALERLRSAVEALSGQMGESLPTNRAGLELLAATARELTLWADLPRGWAVKENLNFHLSQVRKMARHYLSAEDCKDQMRPYWTGAFLQQNGSALLAEFNAANGKWFLGKAIALNNLAKRMAPMLRSPVAKEDLGKHFQILARFQEENSAAERLFASIGGDLDRWLDGERVDWNMVLSKADLAAESALRLYDLWGSDDIRIRCAGVRKLDGAVAEMNGAWAGLTAPMEAMDELLAIRTDPNGSNWIGDRLAICDQVLRHSDGLKEWISWNGLVAEAMDEGLRPVVEAYCAGMPHGDVMPAYERAMYQALAMDAIDGDPALNEFSGALFNEKIAQFKRIDQELTELTRQEIYCRLAARVPNFTKEAAQSSEVGILQRAIRSGGRGISLRKLFEQIPNLLPRLCPCMLMSPISAAQYLDPKREPFSLVVFDEASQLPTCKAVGALARGKEAVIVGDPKQMPPTAFFATNTVDEENLDIEDLESILDDCLAMNMPQTHLLWHYRSRHESLIAFSNSRFYENKLYTFPSVNDRETKVTLIRVDGVFERGKNRQNRAEAEAVVEEIKRRYADPKLRKFSLGVVTFNITQQHLIDDLLTEACAADPGLEKWAYESEEPIFIKNLENVQGDERDVILFSVGYGPDENGKIYMNFGPLNRDGGWRRLNVAVSRSRHEMVVFSTLTAEQIDLSRTSAEGVAALKAFLEYAGGKELPQDEHSAARRKQSCAGIADTICRVLEEQGYRTDRAVGHSEYRIDIAVVDPENPERYLLGILLDGDGYGTAKTTRDRELAQISVLNGLGWQILRVWSMDWWDNSRKELERILSELQRIRREEPAQEQEEPEEPADVPETEGDQPLANPTATRTKKAVDPHQYVAAKLKSSVITAEDFLLPKYTAAIRAKVSAVVEKEAPITEGLLVRRIIQSYGLTRAGSRINSRIAEICQVLDLDFTEHDGQKVYWRKDQDPAQYFGFRCSGEGDAKREVKDVPMLEVVNAVRYVLHAQIGLPKDVLIREAAKLLGYTRSGSVVVPVVNTAIALLEEAAMIRLDANDNYTLTEQAAQEAARNFA